MRAFLILSLLAGPACAQDWQPVWEVQADLDGNGAAETFALRDTGGDSLDLVVTEGDWERVVREAAWGGSMAGQAPELSLSEGGSVLLTMMNEAIGRNRWRLVLTVAHREGDWRVAGITYDWYDTLDLTAWAHCDLNLLSGRGVVEGEAGVREVEAPEALPLWDWREADLPDILPAECFG